MGDMNEGIKFCHWKPKGEMRWQRQHKIMKMPAQSLVKSVNWTSLPLCEKINDGNTSKIEMKLIEDFLWNKPMPLVVVADSHVCHLCQWLSCPATWHMVTWPRLPNAVYRISVIYFRLFRTNARHSVAIVFFFRAIHRRQIEHPLLVLCVRQWINSVCSLSIRFRFHFTFNDRQCSLFVRYGVFFVWVCVGIFCSLCICQKPNDGAWQTSKNEGETKIISLNFLPRTFRILQK